MEVIGVKNTPEAKLKHIKLPPDLQHITQFQVETQNNADEKHNLQ